MKIISHRGYWRSPLEKNSKDAIIRSFKLGFGVETDLRDCQGKLAISHDPPMGHELSFEELLQIHSEADNSLPLALNVKSDGLQLMAADLIQRYSIKEYFFFDMSIPDMVGYNRMGLRFFTRQSELEPEPTMLAESSGVWIDLFHSDWITEGIVASYLKQGKSVCLVSPELHKRDPGSFWDAVATWECRPDSRLMLCTDLPEAARDLLG